MRIQNLRKEEKMKRTGSKLGILKELQGEEEEEEEEQEEMEEQEEEEEEKLPSTCDTPVVT